MDFKSLLLFAGLGLLALIVVFALFGFFAGLKKELKCTAITLVLLFLTLLVFGNSSTLMNMDGSLLKGVLQGIPDSAKTIWECILAFVQGLVANGDKIFAEGTESYAFLYSVVGAVLRAGGLIVGVLVILIVTFLVVIIYRLVSLIVTHAKAKKSVAKEEEDPDVVTGDTVVVSNDGNEDAGAVVTASKKEVPVKKTRHPFWGALVGALTCIFILTFLFAPISGVVSVLDKITPETEQMVKDVLNGENKKTSQTDDLIDMAMDFRDAYHESALGKVVESSGFFFGESFSVKLFDATIKVQTNKGKSYPLRSELNAVLNAVNALEGHSSLETINQENVNNALDALKDSELVVDLIPVALEIGYYYPLNVNGVLNNQPLSDLLFKSGQQAAYLSLRQADWNANIDALLDTVKEVYRLGVLDKDFNPLTMDADVLKAALNKLADADAVMDLLNIILLSALKTDLVVDKIGTVDKDPDLSEFSWREEFNSLVDIFKDFQKLGITSTQNLNVEEIVKDILNDEGKLNTVADIVVGAIDLQLVKNVALQVAVTYATNNVELIKDSGTDIVASIKDLTNVDWTNDVKKYLEAVKLLVNSDMLDFSESLMPKYDYFNFDTVVLHEVVDKLFETESLVKILPIAANIAITLPQYKKLVEGYQVEINTKDIDWHSDFTTLVDIYGEFLKLGFTSLKEITEDVMGTVKTIFGDDAKAAAVEAILCDLADLSLFTKVGTPIGNAVVNNMLKDQLKMPEFADILDISAPSKDEWKEDFKALVDAAKQVYAVCGFEFKPSAIEFTPVNAAHAQKVLEDVLTLNVLGDDATKNELVGAALTKFDVLKGEDFDISDVVWADEVSFLQAVVAKAFGLVGGYNIDIADIKNLDYQSLLNDDQFLDDVVDLIDTLVDSKLVLDLIPGAINAYALPLIEQYDDEDSTIVDTLQGLTSDELINEVIKLVDVARAALHLGALDYVSTNDLASIHFEKTDEIKTIINGIFDSKFIEGREGKVVRILLKVTKLFPDLEKGIFDGIDFDREQQILNDVIDNLAVIMKDDKFLAFENGKFDLNWEFYAGDASLDALFAALDGLVGTWSFTSEEDGSKLVETLLPLAYDKFIAGMIPANFAELVEYTGLADATGYELMTDVRHIVAVAKEAADMGVQNYLINNDFDFTNVGTGVGNILDIVFDMRVLKGKENKFVAWGLNKALEVAKLNGIDEFTEEDFAGVDWAQEVDTLTLVINDAVDLLTSNGVSTVNGLKDFISNKDYLSDSFLNDTTFDKAIKTVDDLVNSQVLCEVLPVALAYGLNIADDKGFDFAFLGEGMTGQLLAEDLHSLIDAAQIAVFDLHAVELYTEKDLDLPATPEKLIEILDIVFGLNLVSGRENRILRTAVDKFLPANPFVTKDDFDFSIQFKWDAEFEVIKAALTEAYGLLAANGINKVSDFKSLGNKFKDIPALATDENIMVIANVLEILADSQLVKQAAVAAVGSVSDLEAVKAYGTFKILGSVTKTEISEDLKTLADVLRLVPASGALQYLTDKDLDPINFAGLAAIVEKLGTLNLINNYLTPVLVEAVNNFNTDKLYVGYTLTEADFNQVNWADEFAKLAALVVEVGDLALANNLDALSDILKFINNKDFLNKTLLTEDNLVGAIDIVKDALDIKLIGAALPFAAEWGLKMAKEKGLDLTFLSGKLTAQGLTNDLYVLVDIIDNAVDFGAIEYVTTYDITDIDVTYVAAIVRDLEKLSILNCASADWMDFAAKMLNEKVLAKLGLELATGVYDNVDFAAENENLALIVEQLGKILADENLTSYKGIMAYVNAKDYMTYAALNADLLNDAADLLSMVADFKVIALNATKLFNEALLMAKKAGYDLTAMRSSVTGNELCEDVKTIASIVKDAVRFGAVELVFGVDITLDLDIIAEIVAKIDTINVLNKNANTIAVVALNAGQKLAKIDLHEFTDANLADVDFSVENEMLQNIVLAVKDAMAALGLSTYSDLVAFKDAKSYMEEATFTNAGVRTALTTIVNEIAGSKLVEVIVPYGVNYGVDFAVKKGIPAGSLKNKYTGADVCHDLPVLLQIAFDAVDFGALEIVNTKDLARELDLTYVENIVANLENLNILTKANKEISSIAANYGIKAVKLVNMLGADYTVDDFAAIDYAAENALLVDAVEAIAKFLDSNNLKTLADIKAFASDKKYMETATYEAVETREAIVAIAEAVADSELIPVFFNKAFPKLLELKEVVKYADVTFLAEKLTGAEVLDDLPALARIAFKALDFGVLELVNNKFNLDVLDKIDLTLIADIVAEFENLNILTKANAELMALALNMGLKVAKLDSKFPTYVAADFENVDFAGDNGRLVIAINGLQQLLNQFSLDNLQDMKDFIASKWYNNPVVTSASTEVMLNNVLVQLVSTDVADVIFDDVLTFAVEMPGVIRYADLTFMEGNYTAAEFAEDIPYIVNSAMNAIEFGAVELAASMGNKNRARNPKDDLQLDYIINIVLNLDEMNLTNKFNKEFTALVGNLLFKMLKIDAEVEAADFGGINYHKENATLVDALATIKALLAEQQLKGITDASKFLTDKQYMKQDVYSESFTNNLANVLVDLGNSKVLSVFLPALFDYGLNAAKKTIDLTFLSGKLTGEQLSEDIKDIASIVYPLVYGQKVFDIIANKEVQTDVFKALGDVVYTLSNTNIAKADPETLTVTVVNLGAQAIKYSGRVEAADFANVDWNTEDEVIKYVFIKLQDFADIFLAANNLYSLDAFKEYTAKENLMANLKAIPEGQIYALLDVIDALADSNLVADLGVFGLEYAVSVLRVKNNIEVSGLVVAPELLQEDIHSLTNAVAKALQVNTLGFALRDEKLVESMVDEAAAAIAKVINLNVLQGANVRPSLIALGLKMIGVEVNKANLAAINWNEEEVYLATLITEAYSVMGTLDRFTLSEITGLFKDKEAMNELAKLNDKLNTYLEKVADVLTAVGNSQLVQELAGPLSHKYVPETLKAFADFSFIYDNGAEIKEDLLGLADAIRAIVSLDIYSITTGDKDIPWGDVDDVEAIISGLFNLNYLNNVGRIDALLATVHGIDLTGINGNLIDLKADGEALVDAYKELTTILTDDEWFYNNVKDIKNIVIRLRYFSQAKYVNAAKTALDDILNTTVVEQSNGAIFLVFVPVLQNRLNDIYTALELDTMTAEKFSEDFTAIKDLILDVFAMDFTNIIDGYYFNNEVKGIANEAIDALSNLNILANHGNALAEAIANRLDGKTIGKVTFNKADYNLADVNFYGDMQALKAIVNNVFDILSAESIKTLNDLNAFVQTLKTKDAIMDFVDTYFDTLYDTLTAALDLSIVRYNALNLYTTFAENTIVNAMNNESLKELVKLSEIYASNDELNDDLVALRHVLTDAKELNAFGIVKGDAIDYSKNTTVRCLLTDLASTTYLTDEWSTIINYVDGLITSVDLSTYGLANMDIANDLAVIADIYDALIPVLTDYRNPFLTVADIKAGKIGKTTFTGLIYDYQATAIADAVELVANISIAADLVKFGANTATSKLTGKALDIVNILDIENVADADILADIAGVAQILRDTKELRLAEVYVSQNVMNLDLADSSLVLTLIDDVYALNMINNKVEDLVTYVVETFLGINPVLVDLTNIDYDAEVETIKTLVEAVLNTVYSVNKFTLGDIVGYVTGIVADVKADVVEAKDILAADKKAFKAAIKAALGTVKQFITDVEVEYLVDAFVAVTESQIVSEVGIQLYNTKFLSKLGPKNSVVYGLNDYSVAMFKEDLGYLATAAKAALDGRLYTVLTNRSLMDKAIVAPALEDMIVAMASLNILEEKKQDFGYIAQVFLGNIPAVQKVLNGKDLSTYKLGSVSFAADAAIYGSMAPYIYDVLNGVLTTGANLGLFGNTEVMSGLVEMYGLSINTTLVQAIAPRAINLANKVAPKLHMTFNSDANAVLNDVYAILADMVEVGFFSNNGFDFTNTAAFEDMKAALYDMVTLPNIGVRVVNALVNRIDAYGVIPFSWNGLSTMGELSALKNTAVKALALVRDNLSKVTSKDISFLADPAVQADITALYNTAVSSQIVAQLVFPVMEGTFKLVTRGQSDGVMVYTATLEDIATKVLPDMYEIFNNVVAITGGQLSMSSINMYSFAEYGNIIEVVGNDILLKDNLGKLLLPVVKRILKVELSDDAKALLVNADWSAEAAQGKAAMDVMEDCYNNNPFTLSELKVSTLNAVADALEVVKNTNTVKALSKAILTLVKDKAASKLGELDFIFDGINDAYTEAMAHEDIVTIISVVRNMAASGVMNSGSEPTTWDYSAAKALIHNVFTLNLVAGNEAEVGKNLAKKLPTIKDYYEESMVIADWEAEFTNILDALEAIVNDGVTDLHNIDVALLSGATMEKVCASVILEQLVVDTINDKLDEVGLNAMTVTAADLATVVDWAKELDAINGLTTLVGAGVTISEATTKYALVENTVLIKAIVTANAEDIVKKMPVVKDNLGLVATAGVTDWKAELDAIIDGVGTLSSTTIDVETITAAQITALLQSKVLKAIIADKINETVGGYAGITYTVTTAKLDTVADWSKELAAINALKKLTGNVQLSEVAAEYAKVNETVLIKDIVTVNAEEIVKNMPVIKDNLALVGTAGVTDWKDELDKIVAGVSTLSSTTIDVETITAAQMEALTESKVLTAIIADKMNTAINGYSGITYTVTTAKINAVTNWSAELGAINALKDLANNAATLSKAQLLANYNTATTGTLLMNDIITENAKSIVEKMPMVDSAAMAATGLADTDTAGWRAELDAIMDVLEEMVAAGIDDLDDPLNDLAGHGEVIVAVLAADTLTHVFTTKLNDALAAQNLTYVATKDELRAIDTAAKWNVEIEQINNCADLAAMVAAPGFGTNPTELDAAKALWNTIKNSSATLAKDVINATLDPAVVAILNA